MSFNIFGKEISLYGLFFFMGILVAILAALPLVKKKKIALFDFTCAAVYILIGILVGAKLLFIVVSIEQIKELAKQLSVLDTVSAVMQGGFVFYGGLIGGALGLFIYGKQFKVKILDYLDVIATVAPFGHAFGRVGCFFGGCCYGMEYHGFGSYTYHQQLTATTPVGVPLLPIQLIEAFCLFCLFIVLMVLFFKQKSKGVPIFTYVVGYAVLRFVLEFFRGDKERGALLGISTSQWISLLLLCIACAACIIYCRKNKIE